MDPKYFRDKAAVCARLAEELSANSSGRLCLLEMAEDFRRRALELEARPAQQQQQPQSVDDKK